MAKVTGIGGVFFKSTGDHRRLAEWYSQNLGIQLEPWGGAILKWTDDKSGDHGLTVWHVAEKNTGWFSPSPASFMINRRGSGAVRDVAAASDCRSRFSAA
jgi:hypothetical protein